MIEFHVEDFAIGGEPAVEVAPVPGRQPFRPVAGILLGDEGAARDRIGFADAVPSAAFRHALAQLDDARARCDAIFRIDLAGEFVGGGAAWQAQARRPSRHTIGSHVSPETTASCPQLTVSGPKPRPNSP